MESTTVELHAQPLMQLTELNEQLPEMKAKGLRELRIDLGAVSFVDSMIIGQLVRMRIGCERSAIRIQLTGMSPNVVRTLSYSGVGELFGIAPAEPPSFKNRT